MHINYQDCISLGFIRENMPEDQVWIDQHGYDFFALTLNVGGGFIFDWDIETGVVVLTREDDSQRIVDKVEIKNINKLPILINYFSNKEHQTELSLITVASDL